MNAQLKSAWTILPSGRKIDLYHSSPNNDQSLQRPVLFIGGVHGDEPEGVALAESTLQWLSNPARGARDILVPWILIPCLNPDGFALNQRVNGNGVDLNRNYPSSNWSSEFKDPRYFPGPQAGSEPEVAALVDLIRQTQPRLIVHCHSWKPCIVLTGPPAQRDAEYLSACSGYEIVETIGYPTPGSLSYFGWHDLQIPVICIEEAERETKATSWTRFQPGLAKMFGDASERR